MDQKDKIVVALIVQGGQDRGFAGDYPKHLVKELNDVLDKMEEYNKTIAK